MSDQFQDNPFRAPQPTISRQHPPLPEWLASRVLDADEQITWVRGPRFNPWWEQYVTHPALFLHALALGAACLGVCRALTGEILLPAAMTAFGIVVGSVFVLGFFAGHFTRLVVTDAQIVILQGYEVCRTWRIDDLPPRLIRYRTLGAGLDGRAVDLDALQAMLGSSDQRVQPKAILAFAKQLDRIKPRQDGYS